MNEAEEKDFFCVGKAEGDVIRNISLETPQAAPPDTSMPLFVHF